MKARRIAALLTTLAMVLSLMGAPLPSMAADLADLSSEGASATVATPTEDVAVPAPAPAEPAAPTPAPAATSKEVAPAVTVAPGVVCAIGTVTYPTVNDAVAAVSPGTSATIMLLADFTQSGGCMIYNKSITFNLNGFNLVFTNTAGAALQVNSASVDYTGAGSIKAIGSGQFYPGVQAGAGTASCKLTSAETDIGSAITVLDSGSFTFTGNIVATGAGGTGVTALGYSNATINGTISAPVYIFTSTYGPFTAAQGVADTSNPGYLRYGEDLNCVWVAGTTALTHQTLTDSNGTGITVTGDFTGTPVLTVTPIGSSDHSGDAIRQAAASGTLLALYDIEITPSGSYTGPLTVKIPVPVRYDNLYVTVYHDTGSGLENKTAQVVIDTSVTPNVAYVTVTLTSLSPVGVVGPNDDYSITRGGVTTGYLWTEDSNINLVDGDTMTILPAATQPAAATAIDIAANADVTIKGNGTMINNLNIVESGSDTAVHNVTLDNLKLTGPTAMSYAYVQRKGAIILVGANEIHSANNAIGCTDTSSVLTISGSGSLLAIGGVGNGIYTQGTAIDILGSADVTAISTGGSAIWGNSATFNIKVASGAKLSATGTGGNGINLSSGVTLLFITCDGTIMAVAGTGQNGLAAPSADVEVAGSGTLTADASVPGTGALDCVSLTVDGATVTATGGSTTAGLSVRGVDTIVKNGGHLNVTGKAAFQASHAGYSITMEPGTVVNWTNNATAPETHPFTMAAAGSSWILSGSATKTNAADALTASPLSITVPAGTTGTISLTPASALSVNVPADITADGVTAHVTVAGATNANGLLATAEQVTVHVTLIGTAPAQGILTLGLTSPSAGAIAGVGGISNPYPFVAYVGAVNTSKDFTLTMPATSVTDLAMTFTFTATTVSGVSANPAILPAAGGTSTITVSGSSIGGTKVAAFDGVLSTTIAGNTGGTNTSQTASLSFPANTSTTADKVYTIKVSLDGGVTWEAQTCTVTVSKAAPVASIAPVITSASSASVPVYTGGTFNVTAAGTAPITYALSGAPSGVVIDASSGVLAVAGGGTVPAGTYTFTITASNGVAPDATQTFTLTVTPSGPAPVLSNLVTSTEPENLHFYIDISSSVSGRLYGAVYPASASVPSIADIKAGTGAATARWFDVYFSETLGSGFNLSENTDYVVYFVASNYNGDSNVVSKAFRTPVAVCEIGGARYATLDAALADVEDGDTITLLQDITLSGDLILKQGCAYTIDTNGYNLDFDGNALSVKNSTVTLAATDVTFTDAAALLNLDSVQVSGSSKATFDGDLTLMGTGDALHLDGTPDSKLCVTGDVTANNVGGGVSGIYCAGGTVAVDGSLSCGGIGVFASANAGGPGTVTIGGSVTATDVGVYAEKGATVEVGVSGSGSVTCANGDAVQADAATVVVHGDVTTNGDECCAVDAYNTATVTVTGDVKTTGTPTIAVYASDGSGVNISGGVTASDYGVDAVNGAHVTVNGDVSAGVIGVYAEGGSEVTINGVINTPGTYVELYDDDTGIYTDLTAADFTTPTTLAGYKTYTDDLSTVWVKASGSGGGGGETKPEPVKPKPQPPKPLVPPKPKPLALPGSTGDNSSLTLPVILLGYALIALTGFYFMMSNRRPEKE